MFFARFVTIRIALVGRPCSTIGSRHVEVSLARETTGRARARPLVRVSIVSLCCGFRSCIASCVFVRVSCSSDSVAAAGTLHPTRHSALHGTQSLSSASSGQFEPRLCTVSFEFCVSGTLCTVLCIYTSMSMSGGDERAKFDDPVWLTEQRFPGDSKGNTAAIPTDC